MKGMNLFHPLRFTGIVRLDFVRAGDFPQILIGRGVVGPYAWPLPKLGPIQVDNFWLL